MVGKVKYIAMPPPLLYYLVGARLLLKRGRVSGLENGLAIFSQSLGLDITV